MGGKYSFKQPKSGTIVASSTTIPTAFATTAGSSAITGMSDSPYSHVLIVNTTTAVISWTTIRAGDPAPSSSTAQRIYVPASGAVVADDILISDTILVQSEGSAITSGTVYVSCW